MSSLHLRMTLLLAALFGIVYANMLNRIKHLSETAV